jgi:hypothetical protein
MGGLAHIRLGGLTVVDEMDLEGAHAQYQGSQGHLYRRKVF